MSKKIFRTSLFVILLWGFIQPVCSPASEIATEVRIAASSDDAEEFPSGTVKLTGTDLDLIYSEGDGDQTVGMRFYGVDVPRGATIVNAYLQFQADETDSVATSLSIQGEAVDNAATFTTASWGITSRPRTMAAASWSPPTWTTVGEAGPDQRTSDIGPVIQEIVNRPGWTAGNSLAIIITGSGEREAEAYDGDHPEGASLLHVVYDPLPPDPGEAGKATLEGIDSDGDGIRDDVQRFIALEYPNSEKTRKALTQMAVTMQDFILHSQDKEAVMDSMDALGRATDCLVYISPDNADDIGARLEAAAFNTEGRIRAYIDASALLGGGTFPSLPPDEMKKGCDFNPDDLAN